MLDDLIFECGDSAGRVEEGHVSEERRRRQAERARRRATSHDESVALRAIHFAKAKLPHPLWGLVIAALLTISGHNYLVLRSIGLSLVTLWLAVEFLAWWLERKWIRDFQWIVGIAVCNGMFVVMMLIMRCWLALELEDQRTNVFQHLTISYYSLPHKEASPQETVFRVTNNSTYNLSGRRQLVCYLNYAVGNNRTSTDENMWQAFTPNPVTRKWKASFGGGSSYEFLWPDIVPGAPLLSNGDADTYEQCLGVLRFKDDTQCIDLSLIFLYSLETQPNLKQEKESRIVGTMEGDQFVWQYRPVQSNRNYCEAYRPTS